jgi:hypothetical protein
MHAYIAIALAYYNNTIKLLTIGRTKIAAMKSLWPARAMTNRSNTIARIVTPIVARTVRPAITEFSMISYDKK